MALEDVQLEVHVALLPLGLVVAEYLACGGQVITSSWLPYVEEISSAAKSILKAHDSFDKAAPGGGKPGTDDSVPRFRRLVDFLPASLPSSWALHQIVAICSAEELLTQDGLPGVLLHATSACPRYPSFGFGSRGSSEASKENVDSQEVVLQKCRALAASEEATQKLLAVLKVITRVVSSMAPPLGLQGEVMGGVQASFVHAELYRNNALHLLERVLRTANETYKLARNDVGWEQNTGEPLVALDPNNPPPTNPSGGSTVGSKKSVEAAEKVPRPPDVADTFFLPPGGSPPEDKVEAARQRAAELLKCAAVCMSKYL